MLLSFEDSGWEGRSVPGGQVPLLPVSKCRVECLLEALIGAITRSHLLVGQAASKDLSWHRNHQQGPTSWLSSTSTTMMPKQPIFKPPPNAFRDTIAQLRQEVTRLSQDNTRLRRLVQHQGAELRRVQSRMPETRSQLIQTDPAAVVDDDDHDDDDASSPTEYLPGVLYEQALHLQARRDSYDGNPEEKTKKLASIAAAIASSMEEATSSSSSSSSSSSATPSSSSMAGKRPLPPGKISPEAKTKKLAAEKGAYVD